MITDKQGHKRLKRPSPFLGACVAVAVLALLLVIYNFSKPVPMVGSKTITIDVVYKDGSEDSYHVTTEAQYLKEAVDDIPELTIEGTTTEEYGLMMITVNGVRADYTQDGAYWALLLDRSYPTTPERRRSWGKQNQRKKKWGWNYEIPRNYLRSGRRDLPYRQIPLSGVETGSR